ncbi:MAG: vitamin K epoxide reductase family protein, partial [Rhodothermia bacterium]
MARPAKKTGGSDQAAQNQARMLNRIIFGVALFGTLLTLHLWIQSERGFSHGCFGFSDSADAGVVECTAVLQSDAGKLFGISNIVYGFFFFGAIAVMSFASVLAQKETAKKIRKASFVVASIGVAYALYLFSYQVFVLGQFCQLCLTTGLTTAVVFGLHAVEWAGKSVAQFELSDLVREVGLFILMTLIAGMLLVAEVFFLNRIGTLEPMSAAETSAPANESVTPPSPSGATPATIPTGQSGSGDIAQMDPEEVRARLDQVCRFDPAMGEIPNVAALTRNAPYLGSDTASVALIEFFDPNCPHCKTLHQNTPAIMARLGGRARIYYKPYPIWPYSYTQVEALYQAQDEGLFLEMLQLQM